MPPLVRRLFLCAIAMGGFAGMAALLHRVAPPRVPEVTPKLDYLEGRLGEYDTVFIGSSRIYHGVSPKAFDAVMAGAGRPARSFNLAIDGMMPPESLHMARTLIAMRPPGLRRIFIEVSSTRDIPEMSRLTVRDVYWQDLATLEHWLRRAPVDYSRLKGKYRWPKAWEDISTGATLFARNEFNIGRLAPDTGLAGGSAPEQEGDSEDSADQRRLGESALGPDQDGFLPELHPLTPARRAQLDKGLEAVRNGTAKTRPRDPQNTEDYARLRDLAASRGVELILVAAPVTTRDFNAKQDAPPGMKLLAFDDPRRYPELYTPEHRFDYDHLNGDGAQIFSRELAEAYLAGK